MNIAADFSVRHRFVHLPDGGRLAFAVAVAGEKQPGLPILLHRPLGGSMLMWGDFARRLADFHPVVMFDPRGVGQPGDVPLLHSTRAMAADATTLLDDLQIEKAHVFGLSLGGMVACWQALDTPQRIGRLVLASTLPGPDAVSLRTLVRALPFVRCFADSDVAFETCLVRHVLTARFMAENPERSALIEQQVRALPSTRRNLLMLMQIAMRHSVDHQLQMITCPTLLLFGERDALAGRAAQIELSSRLTDAVMEIVPGAGHDLSLEKPVALAERMHEFLVAPVTS